MFIWSLTKFPGLSKINDLTRKINQQPTPSYGIQAGARRSRVKFYQIIGIQRWGIFCVFPCLDSQLNMVEGEALQWIVIENIEQRSTLRSLNLPKLPQTWLGIECLSCFWNWILISGHVFVQILFSIKQNFKTYSDNADAHESWLKVCQSFSWVLSLTKSFLSPSAARLLRGMDCGLWWRRSCSNVSPHLSSCLLVFIIRRTVTYIRRLPNNPLWWQTWELRAPANSERQTFISQHERPVATEPGIHSRREQTFKWKLNIYSIH